VTGRPVLTLVRPWDGPDHRHGPGWWWFRCREAAATVRWRLVSSIVATVATAGMRERAWAAGFALALGRHENHFWASHAAEYRSGNEVAHELRYRRRDLHVNGVCCPFALPDPAALAALSAEVAAEELASLGQPAATWPPLVAPRRIVVSEGRHAAPGPTTRRPRGDRSRPPARHRRPRWRILAAGWLRHVLPGHGIAPGRHARTGPLSAAA
jgi:hypothetical protein